MVEITAAEKARRRRIVESSHTIVALEGVNLTPADLELKEMYVNGQIGMKEFISRGIALHSKHERKLKVLG